MKGRGKGDVGSVMFRDKEEEGGRERRYFSFTCEDEVKS